MTPYKIPMADPIRIYNHYKGEHDDAIRRVVDGGKYILGEDVKHFSDELSMYLDQGKSIVSTCANGSDALLISYMVLGLKAGDSIIMPSHNYVSSLESALRLGLVPILADLDDREEFKFSLKADQNYLDSLLTPETKAIVVVNMYGIPCDISFFRKYCDNKGLFLIEDNSHGIGGQYSVGSYTHHMSTVSDISTTSFFPTKPLGCLGDGGAIITRDKDLAYRAQVLSNHGQRKKYDYVDLGLNSRLDTIQAAILRVRLKYLIEIVDSYRTIAKIYSESIDFPEIELPKIPLNSDPTFYQYTILLPTSNIRDDIFKMFRRNGIELNLYYPHSLHNISCYKKSVIFSPEFKNTDTINTRMLSLPIFPFMEEQELEYVVSLIKKYFA